MKPAQVLAFDLGASSGRAMLARFDGERIALTELHRFSNDPVEVNGTLYWDVLRLVHELKQGLLCAKTAGVLPDSIGIDTWGVDFGLLDADGVLMENPVHYRDRRTAGAVAALSPEQRERLYEATGTQLLDFNTLFQLGALRDRRPAVLERAETLLMMPDLLRYLLTGVRETEYTIASTTQLLDPHTRAWSDDVIAAYDLPRRLFTDMVQPGGSSAPLSKAIQEELGLPPIPVVSVAGHDTQCAIIAVPTDRRDFAFISCGTWSLLGTELPEPLIDAQSNACQITNEGGVGGHTTFLKNLVGLWLIQESRRQWKREGREYSFAELERLALEAPAFVSRIDPDAPDFAAPGDIPARIRAYCRRTEQPEPATVGAVVRCIYESLALSYRDAVAQLESCTGKTYDTIYMVGGGTKDRLLCRMTAEICGRRVVAGPAEATALGNAAIQLMAAGAIPDLAAARAVIARSDPPMTFDS